MSYDWDTLDKQQPVRNTQYKTYAPNGEYTVKLEKVEVVDRGSWKSPALTFSWAEDDEHRYCRSVYHWLSIENENYRRIHNRFILLALGVEKTKAQQLIDTAENDQSREGLKKGYEIMYKRVAERKPTTKILIQDQWRDGKPVVRTSEKGTQYTPNESDFADFGARVMETHESTPLAGAEEVDLGDSPF